MKKIIHQLREKPDHVKTRFAILFALIATLIIVGIWIGVNRSIKNNDDTIRTQSPFSIFSEIFQTAISDIKSQQSPLPSPETINPVSGTVENDTIQNSLDTESVSETNVLFSPTGNTNTEPGIVSEGIPSPVLSE